jgi:hypothetical protein
MQSGGQRPSVPQSSYLLMTWKALRKSSAREVLSNWAIAERCVGQQTKWPRYGQPLATPRFFITGQTNVSAGVCRKACSASILTKRQNPIKRCQTSSNASRPRTGPKDRGWFEVSQAVARPLCLPITSHADCNACARTGAFLLRTSARNVCSPYAITGAGPVP